MIKYRIFTTMPNHCIIPGEGTWTEKEAETQNEDGNCSLVLAGYRYAKGDALFIAAHCTN